MQKPTILTVAYAVAAVLCVSSALAEQPLIPRVEPVSLTRPAMPSPRPKQAAHALIGTSAPELATRSPSNAGFSTKSAFSTASVPSPDSSNLSPPVTISYTGSSPVLQIEDGGTNKGVLSQITNSHNSTSALYGVTNGSGAGLTGYNSGTSGPGGKFGVINSSSAQPGAFATTNGTGSALLGTITTPNSDEPAILGQNAGSTSYGIGVEGQGGNYGIYGSGDVGVYSTGTTYGLIAYTPNGTAFYGQSSNGTGLYVDGGGEYGAVVNADAGIGLYSYSNSSYGISVESATGTGLIAKSDGNGNGIKGESNTGFGILATSTSGYALVAQSRNAYGVVGQDFGSGVGVYGESSSGYAGYFAGKIGAESYYSLSDRNAKTKIHAIDSKAILDKVDSMPVSSWVFKKDPLKNHVGPMAQDFHAAFGLAGDDDKHINLTDIAGVSLASIQELSKEMKDKDAQLRIKDAQIAELQDQLKALNDTVSARLTALEQQQQRLGDATLTANSMRGTFAGSLRVTHDEFSMP